MADEIKIEDSCGNKILISFDVTNNSVVDACGVYEFNHGVTIVDGSEFVKNISTLITINGQSSGACANSSSFFYFENPGFYGGTLRIAVIFESPCNGFYQEDFSFSFVVDSCSEIKCSSAFDFCSYAATHNRQELLLEVYYNDPTYGPQRLDENNDWGIFHFPYYNEFVDWNLCDERDAWIGDPPVINGGLCGFVNDVNRFLSLSTSGLPKTENLSGRLDFHHPTPIPDGYCKKYFKFLSTGVFFFKFKIKIYITNEDTCFIDFSHERNEYITQDYPPSYACVPTAYTIDNNENSYFYSDFELKKTLNISEEDKNDMYCYPSITSSEFKISNANKSNLSISIYSISGQLMDEININNTSKKIDISDYISGLYIVKIKDMQNGIIKTEKIIKH